MSFPDALKLELDLLRLFASSAMTLLRFFSSFYFLLGLLLPFLASASTSVLD